MKELDGFSAAITIQKDIDFQVAVNTKEAQTKQWSLANLAKLAIGGVRGKVEEKAKDDERAAAALNVMKSITATATGSTLMIRGQISFETLEKIIQLIPGMPGN